MRYTGISAYASMHPEFPVGRFLRQFPDDIKYPAISVLSGSFGWDSQIIERFVKKFADRPHLIEIFLANGCARRRGQKEAGSLASEYSIAAFNRALTNGEKRLREKVARRITKIQKHIFSYGNPNTRFVLALELEDNMSDAAAENFVGLVRKLVPTIPVLRNPLKSSASQGSADYFERHAGGWSSLKRGMFYNMDGLSVDYDDGENFFQPFSFKIARDLMRGSRATATFIWSARQQGYPIGFEGWENVPAKRSRTFVVTDRAIEGARWLLSEESGR